MDKKEFLNYLDKLNINYDDNKLKQLNMYYNLLIQWNSKMNLTAITEKKEVYLKHFYDSLTIVKIIDLNKIETLCDVGTGAGFPGIVLKIFFPHLKITLIDSLNKRLIFLQEVIDKLVLKDINIVHVRAEEYKKRENFDLVVARAVAPISILVEICSPLVKVNKYFIAYKALENDIKDYEELNIKLDNKIIFNLYNNDYTRTLLKYIKIDNTPLKFPRKYSDIKKKPL